MRHSLTWHHETGATLTELLIATPLILLLGMTGVQYALMYNAKTNVTYASYEAARAGAINHADPKAIEDGLLKGMLPLFIANNKKYAGDAIKAKLAMENMKRHEAPYMKVEIISPSEQAFTACNNRELQAILKTSNKVIPNKYSDTEHYECADPNITIAQANVLKLRITYGYKPNIPLAKDMFISVSSFIRGSQEAFDLKLLSDDRIPITVDVSAQMLSPAVENGLTTEAYTPPKGDTPLPTGIKLPDISGVKLPDGYENMSVDEIIDIMSKQEGGAGSIGGGRSKNELLAILIAMGIIGAGAYQMNDHGEINLISDFVGNCN